MKYSVIIVAGGKGLRMGGDLPKQFLPIADKPVLMRTIEAFYHFDSAMQIILVLPLVHQEFWKSLCAEYSFTIPHQIATGGETRFHSVKNGLELSQGDVTGVHDGVRPFVSNKVIQSCYQEADEVGAVVPVVDVVETLRHIISPNESKTVNRSDYKLIQTPQVFQTKLLRQAYQQEYSPLFTDDASVVEALGYPIYLVEGNRENIKITTPFDLKISDALV